MSRAGGIAPRMDDFFVCDFLGVAPKHDLASMEHPLFSLATRPDRRILSYRHNDVEVTVTPSVKGRATIFDADILIFCISQLMAALNAGRAVGRTLTLTAHDLLLATGRETGGDSYRRLREAFERLAGTRITTNIVTGDEEVTSGFGLIEAWEIVRRTRAGRMVRHKAVIEGVELTMRELLNVFRKHGIEPISPQVGERFDPQQHEAMFEAPLPGTRAGEIIQVEADGFMLHDRLLRPARVGVSSVPSS
ncbi:MAG: nucleotide exchange factor GrpE [Pseudomonadota bacterium]|nr:nucleotide exchange factor GrpE [Pseudomonadota bacterium]